MEKLGSPLVDDISWCCDDCGMPIKKEDLYRPDPNKYMAFHKWCKP